ncbi:ABC-2 transporter permease [Blautia schinkii]|nr:ABC-2 transporter permease [Blautia schinkii]
MKGLIRADYYIIKEQLGSYFKLFGFFAVISLFAKSSMYIVNMQAVFSAMILISMMAADENGRDAYYQQLPFDRRELVKEKYVRGCVFLLPFMLMANFVGFIITLICELDFLRFFTDMEIGIVYLFLSIDIVIPFAIKKGVAKARLAGFAFVFVPCLVLVYLTKFIVEDMPGIDFVFVVTILMLVLAVLSILLLPFSYRLSLKYYQEREF